jgi:tetratricopeptide (TPR) repeat protein
MSGVPKSGMAANVLVVTLCGLWSAVASAGQDAVSLFEDGKRFMRAGKYGSAVESYTKALARVEPDKRNVYTVRLSRAQAYLNKGDLQPAAQDIIAVLQAPGIDGETTASALRLRGALNLKQERYKQAVTCFSDAIKIQHNNNDLRSTCFAERGITWINMGETGKAVSDLTQALQLDPKSGYAYAARGLAHLREDRIEAARKDSQKALSLNPGKQAEKIARQVLRQLSLSASGPASVEVPLDERGHLMVQVRFSKKGTPHRFMLDTGATYSLIGEDLLLKIGEETEVRRVGQSRAQTADGSSHSVILYKVKNAFLYHLPLGEIVVGVPERPRGKLTYLLGVKSLRDLRVTIDNAKQTGEIRLTTAESRPAAAAKD